MKIDHTTKLWVLGEDGLSEMTFGQIALAIKGGMEAEKVQLFTGKESAEEADNLRKIRQRITARLGELGTDALVRAEQFVMKVGKGAG